MILAFIEGGADTTARQFKIINKCLESLDGDCSYAAGHENGKLTVEYGFGELLGFAFRGIKPSPTPPAPPSAPVGGCFVAGTQISTANGPVAIEDISPGASVWAENTATGAVSLRTVTNVFILTGRSAVDVSFESGDASETVRSTTEHPYWTLDGWVAASALRPGDRILTRSQEWREVTNVQLAPGLHTVYNFAVDIDHSYFVGSSGYLVHNTSSVGRALRSFRHHLMTNKNMSSSTSGGPWTPRLFKIAKKAGISLDDPANIVDIVGHQGPYPELYHQTVYRRLTQATKNLRGSAYRAAFLKELQSIGIEAATPRLLLERTAGTLILHEALLPAR